MQRLEWAPVVRMRIQRVGTDEEMRADLAEIEASMQDDLRRKVRRIVIIDLTGAAGLTPLQRKLQTEWQKRTRTLLGVVSLGMAFIAPSALVRGVLTAMFWISPLPVPHAVVGDMNQAIDFAITQLERAGVQVPERLRRERARIFD